MARKALLLLGALLVPLIPFLTHCHHGEGSHLELAGHCHAAGDEHSHCHAGHGKDSRHGAKIVKPGVSHEPASRADLHVTSPKRQHTPVNVPERAITRPSLNLTALPLKTPLFHEEQRPPPRAPVRLLTASLLL